MLLISSYWPSTCFICFMNSEENIPAPSSRGAKTLDPKEWYFLRHPGARNHLARSRQRFLIHWGTPPPYPTMLARLVTATRMVGGRNSLVASMMASWFFSDFFASRAGKAGAGKPVISGVRTYNSVGWNNPSCPSIRLFIGVITPFMLGTPLPIHPRKPTWQ